MPTGGTERHHVVAPHDRACHAALFGAKLGWTTAPSRVSAVALTISSSHLTASALAALVDQDFEKGVEVLGVEARGGGGEPARHVEVTDDLDAVHRHDLAALGAFDIAAALDREIDDHRARPHRGDHILGDEPRRRPAGNERGGDDDVLLLDVVGDQRGLLGLVLLRHFLGVAGRGLGLLEFLVLDGDELGAEAFDLLLGGGAHVGRGHDRAEPARGRDRLQAGDARAHDEHPRRRHGAGRGHHHRQRAAVFGRAVDHRAIAGEIGLAREHVHGLRAGDARHQLHREGGDAGIRHRLERRLLAVRVHDGDDQRALLVAGELGGARDGAP